MMKHKKFLFFCIKVVLFISSIQLLLLPFAVKIHNFQKELEPRYPQTLEQRNTLFHQDDIGEYSCALMGDSVFCSSYVNNESDTLWGKFESFTGRQCFPGALDGVGKGDLVNIAKYMSQEMPANSTIFLDIIPTRFLRGVGKDNNYERQIVDLRNRNKCIKYFRYMNCEYVHYALLYFQGVKSDPWAHAYDRIWNVDGDFAKLRYGGFLDAGIKTTNGEMKWLAEINTIFHEKTMNVIFVLTPLNKKLIYTYSDKNQANLIYYKLKEINRQTKMYLNKINASYINLFESVPDNGFADMMHTNACGDEIIAKSLADYVAKVKK